MESSLASLLECPLCLSTFTLPMCTPCGHVFCSTCLSRSLNASSPPVCPLCRAPCYIQPGYERTKRPVVVIEKIIELLGNTSATTQIPQIQDKEFNIGLFVCDEPDFAPIPNRMIKIRAFEPRVILLINRCAQTGARFGLQRTLLAKHGVLMRVDSITPIFNSAQLVADCFCEGMYEMANEDMLPMEEENTQGLHNVLVREMDMSQGVLDAATVELAKRCKQLFEAKLAQLGPSVASQVFQDPYSRTTVHVLPNEEDPVQLSFFLLDVLAVQNMDMRFECNVTKRLEYCLQELERGEELEFKCEARNQPFSRMLFPSADRSAIEFSRNALFATGWLVLLGVAMGGFEVILQGLRRQ